MAKKTSSTPVADPPDPITSDPASGGAPLSANPTAIVADPAAPASKKADDTPTAKTETDIADELRESDTMNQLLGLPNEVKKADVDPDAEAAAKTKDDADKKEDDAKSKKESEKKFRVKPAAEPESRGVTAKEAAEIAAQTVAEFRKTEPKPGADEPTVPDEIPAELKAHAPDYSELETLFPDKYKPGLIKRIAGFKAQELKYADEWESKNKGETYNSEDTEHAAFYEKNQPVIDPSDLEEARFERRYKQRMARDVQPKLDELDRKEAFQKSEPVARQAAGAVLTKMFLALNDKHEGPVTPEIAAKWAVAEPVAAEITKTVGEEFVPVAYAASLLWDGVEKFAESNPAHVAARTLFGQMETELAAMKPGELTNAQGQNWIPLAKFNALSAAQRKQFYTTSKESLVNYTALTAADKAKKTFEETEAKEKTRAEYYAKKFGYVKQPAGNGAPETSGGTPTLPATTPRSPSLGGGTPTAPTTGTAPVTQPETTNVIDRLLGLPDRKA